MTQRNQKPRRNTLPYLSSEEVITLTGANRRLLTTVVERGICVPHRDEVTGAFCWTNGQVELIREFHRLRSVGTSLDEIACLVKTGGPDLQTAVNEATMELNRTHRRYMKRIMLQSATAMANERVGAQDGFYIRYIPQRWMALMPQAAASVKLKNSYVSDYMQLSSIASRVGWAPGGIEGTLIAAPMSADSGCFVFMELASQPQPMPFPRSSADSGCYRCIDETATCAYQPKDAKCNICARFGGDVTAGDRLQWEQYASMTARDEHTVMLDEIERPYPSGPWSELTQRATSATAPSAAPDPHHETRNDLAGLVAVRPRLMPHEVRLPLGTTACVMPAGTYLCCQCETNHLNRKANEMASMARVIPHRDMTLEEEMELSARLCKLLESQRDWRWLGVLDERTDLVDGLVQIGDEAQMGWWRPLEDSELSKLVIPTATGLVPNTDYTLVCANVPSTDPNELHRIELQLLVDPSGIALENAPEKRGMGRRALGIARRIAGIALESGEAPSMRCRFCGDDVHAGDGARIVVCPNCGHMQVAPDMGDMRKATVHRQADDLREAGNFDAAALVYRHMLEDGVEDVEVRWMLMVCRYGIHYVQNRESGVFEPVVELPSPVPIPEDSDCAYVLQSASDSEWHVYRRQVDAMETARLAALQDEPAITAAYIVEERDGQASWQAVDEPPTLPSV